MRKFMKEVRKNLYKRYTQPEDSDYVFVLIMCFIVGIALNILFKGLA